MIPKKIHYIWVGGKEKPKDIQKCMKTWRKKLKGYEIIEWNENNFDINSHPFCKAAYKAKKWAFVSDYIRAYVIYKYGGIYLDTDIVVLDNVVLLLNNKAFVGFENKDHPFTATFGAIKGHPLAKDMLKYYENLKNYDFSFNSNNTISVSEILINKYDCVPNNRFQIIKSDIAVYPDYILCNPSKKSITIHIFTGTWLDDTKPFFRNVIKNLKICLTNKNRAKLYRRIIMKKND